ncbi:hypothetical protein [Streptomyces sp. CC208A]|uniref:hypothetical protein n=1 Tax=Streptomyces sp. CC208A TaxID=3044573 RepID=UPI0024A92A5A|nr:hypothetical protein [Streptomyces sp. CC208A]
MLDTSGAASAWLAEADPDPEHAQRWLSSAKVVLLPLGRRWSAVKASETIGLPAAQVLDVGPVIYEPAGRAVFFLVPVDTQWDHPGTELLGDTTWLTVPVPTVTAPPGPHWLTPPDGSGRLVDPSALRVALGPRLRAEHFG